MKTIIVAIVSLLLSASYTLGQDTRTIHLMRAKKFYGSGVKMDVIVNDTLIEKLSSGKRLDLTFNASDTVTVQIIYPQSSKYKSEPYIVLPSDDREIYLDLYYSTNSNDTSRNGEVSVGAPAGNASVSASMSIGLGIMVEKMSLEEGRERFNDNRLFKDDINNIKTINRFTQ